MKKITTLFVLISLVIFSLSVKSQAISNLDFETWESDVKAENWSSQISISAMGILNLNFDFATQSTESHSGNYAMALNSKTQDFSMLGAGVFTIPPVLQLGSTSTVPITMDMIDMLSEVDFSDSQTLLQLAGLLQGLVSPGLPVAAKPEQVKLWVKSNVPDTLAVMVFSSYEGNPVQTGMGMTITSSEWTEISVPLTDVALGVTPDTLGIIVTCGGADVPGTTTFYVDDVTLVAGPTQIPLKSRLDFKSYPNPVNGMMKIELEGEYSIRVFDITGKSVLTQGNLQGVSTVDLSALTPGVYMLEVMQGDKTQVEKIVIE